MYRFAIAIPSFNRAESIILLLNSLPLSRLSIPIYILDDSTDDLVNNSVIYFLSNFSNIYYKRNNTTLGHDQNFIELIKWVTESCSCDYIWHLTDATSINLNFFDDIAMIMNQENSDIVVVNTIGNRVRNIPQKIYRDTSEFMLDLGWHVTLSGSVIYKINSIKRILTSFDITKYKNFPQIGLIFEILNSDDASVYWSNYPAIGKIDSGVTSYWSKKIFDVFFKDLTNTIFNLPKKYSDEIKLNLVIKHTKYSKILSLKNLLAMSEKNILTWEVFINYRVFFKAYGNNSLFTIYLALITPKILIYYLRRFNSLIKSLSP